nr:MAG TPA: hypothetical protein [Caudoviricetes sp.]
MRFVVISPTGSTPLSSTKTENRVAMRSTRFFLYLRGFSAFLQSATLVAPSVFWDVFRA